MINIKGDLFTYAINKNTDGRIICITTNGFIKKNGSLVMGAGCAKTAARMFPHLPKLLGSLVENNGNRVIILNGKDYDLYSNGICYNIATFPVKHSWYEKADIDLIRKSSIQLREETLKDWDYVVIPRPGCGNGRLSYKAVEPVISNILVEPMYMVITFEGRE